MAKATQSGQSLNNPQTIQILANSKVFANFEPEQLIRIIRIATLKEFAPGDLLLDHQWLNTKLYIILNGQVTVLLPDEDPHLNPPIELAKLSTSDTVGEFSIIDKKATSARVVVNEATATLEVKQQDLEKLLAEDDSMAVKIYKNLLHIVLDRSRIHLMDTDAAWKNP